MCGSAPLGAALVVGDEELAGADRVAVEDADECRAHEEADHAGEHGMPEGELCTNGSDDSGEAAKGDKGRVYGEGRCPGLLVHAPTLTTRSAGREDERSPHLPHSPPHN